MLDLFDNVWTDEPTISLDNCIDLTLQVNRSYCESLWITVKALLTLEDRACYYQCCR